MKLSRTSRLTFRVSHERLSLLMRLCGRNLDLNGHSLTISVATPYMLKPASKLRSRLVVIKGFTDEDSFIEACKRQLLSKISKEKYTIKIKFLFF